MTIFLCQDKMGPQNNWRTEVTLLYIILSWGYYKRRYNCDILQNIRWPMPQWTMVHVSMLTDQITSSVITSHNPCIDKVLSIIIQKAKQSVNDHTNTDCYLIPAPFPQFHSWWFPASIIASPISIGISYIHWSRTQPLYNCSCSSWGVIVVTSNRSDLNINGQSWCRASSH